MNRIGASFVLACVLTLGAAGGEMKQESASGIAHEFLVCGNETYIVSKENKVTWTYPRNTRDGWVLPNGNVLLAVTKCKDYPSGAVVEINKDGKVVFEFKGHAERSRRRSAAGERQHLDD